MLISKEDGQQLISAAQSTEAASLLISFSISSVLFCPFSRSPGRHRARVEFANRSRGHHGHVDELGLQSVHAVLEGAEGRNLLLSHFKLRFMCRQDFAPKRRTLNEVMIFNPHYVCISALAAPHPPHPPPKQTSASTARQGRLLHGHQ